MLQYRGRFLASSFLLVGFLLQRKESRRRPGERRSVLGSCPFGGRRGRGLDLGHLGDVHASGSYLSVKSTIYKHTCPNLH